MSARVGARAAAPPLVVALLAAAALTSGGSATAAEPGARALTGPSDNTPASCPPGTTPTCPSDDPFYAPPADLDALPDGALIRSRPVTPTGDVGLVASSATTVLYRTTDTFGAPVVTATTVLLPAVPYPGQGPQPLVSFQFAEDSLGRQCAPSYAVAHGSNAIVQAEAPYVQALLASGYVVSLPDYQGPAEQFTAGRMAGHGVLDGLRAAQQLRGAGLSPDGPVGLVGYSGGGLATGWAAQLHPSYAPDLDLVGVVAGGVPADLKATAAHNDGSLTFGLVALALGGLNRAYPEVDIPGRLLNDAGRQLRDDIETACVGDAAFAYPGRRAAEFTVDPEPLESPVLAPIFAHTFLGGAPPTAPVFEYHVVSDEVVPYAQGLELVNDWCDQGTPVTHVPLAGDHVSGEPNGAPLGLAWLGGRFAGEPVSDTCAVTAAADPTPGDGGVDPDASPPATPTSPAQPAPAGGGAPATTAPQPRVAGTAGRSLPATGAGTTAGLVGLAAAGAALLARRRPSA